MKNTKNNPPSAPRNSRHFMDVIQAVAAQRSGQRQDFISGAAILDMAAATPDANRKLRELTRALGVVAGEVEVLDWHSQKDVKGPLELRAALRDLAAHTIGWLEAIETELNKKG